MKPRNAAAVVVAAVIIWVLAGRAPGRHGAPKVPTVSSPTGVSRLRSTQRWADDAGRVVTEVVRWLGDHQALVGLVVGAIVLVGLVRAVRARMPVPQDPQRMYTTEERIAVFARAGGRCEYDGWFRSRCNAPAEHADHLHPWSRGGATSLKNGVASCARHNLSKGAKVLPGWRVRRLVRRRRRYFPTGQVTVAGERYRDRVVAAAGRGYSA